MSTNTAPGLTGEKIEIGVSRAREMIYGDDPDFEVISDEITGTRRWSVDYFLVVRRKSDGKLFADCYSRGSTECQDESPWEYNEPNFREVREVEKITKDYKFV